MPFPEGSIRASFPARTYSIAAVATFFLTLIINLLLGEESRFGYTYPEVVPEVQLKGPTPVLDHPQDTREIVPGLLRLSHLPEGVCT